jgi:hypothetical protein
MDSEKEAKYRETLIRAVNWKIIKQDWSSIFHDVDPSVLEPTKALYTSIIRKELAFRPPHSNPLKRKEFVKMEDFDLMNMSTTAAGTGPGGLKQPIGLQQQQAKEKNKASTATTTTAKTEEEKKEDDEQNELAKLLRPQETASSSASSSAVSSSSTLSPLPVAHKSPPSFLASTSSSASKQRKEKVQHRAVNAAVRVLAKQQELLNAKLKRKLSSSSSASKDKYKDKDKDKDANSETDGGDVAEAATKELGLLRSFTLKDMVDVKEQKETEAQKYLSNLRKQEQHRKQRKQNRMKMKKLYRDYNKHYGSDDYLLYTPRTIDTQKKRGEQLEDDDKDNDLESSDDEKEVNADEEEEKVRNQLEALSARQKDRQEQLYERRGILDRDDYGTLASARFREKQLQRKAQTVEQQLNSGRNNDTNNNGDDATKLSSSRSFGSSTSALSGNSGQAEQEDLLSTAERDMLEIINEYEQIEREKEVEARQQDEQLTMIAKERLERIEMGSAFFSLFRLFRFASSCSDPTLLLSSFFLVFSLLGWMMKKRTRRNRAFLTRRRSKRSDCGKPSTLTNSLLRFALLSLFLFCILPHFYPFVVFSFLLCVCSLRCTCPRSPSGFASGAISRKPHRSTSTSRRLP